MQELARAWAKNGWKHIAVALAYAAGLWLFRQLVIPHYVLMTGMRVLALTLVPYRYWPALMVGEEFALVPMTIACWAQLGPVWSLLNLLPATAFSAPIVYAARQRGPLVGRTGHVHVGVLLVVALGVAAVCTGYNMLMVSTATLPANYPTLHYDQLASEWLLGNFLGILTLVPLALAMHQVWKQHGWKGWWQQAGENRIVFESACLTMPMLAVLLWIGFTLPHVRGIAQVCMFLPVVWLALRHGWQGAAIGGTLGSLAVVVLMPEKFDHGTLQAEVIVAFAISTMLLVGARIGVLSQRSEKEQADLRLALELARSNFHMGELQMRATSYALDQIRESVRGGYAVMLGRLRHLQPAVDDVSYRRVASSAQDQILRLADSLHPLSWRERGLPAALREGPMARTLREAGVRYECDLHGPVSELSAMLHLVIYRTICESVAEGCSREDVSAVRVRVRSRRMADRLVVATQVRFSRGQALDAGEVRWDELTPRLTRSSSGLGMKALRDRAASFEGRVRMRERPDGRSISCLMLDP
ncbi:MASE1 domain-containing protein [Dyella acidiphila]|uniref:MASE1 domain-containing protein n=1 Tax=Dyella acidiphila TaxID=2775866 RepID=A0ABR9GEN4_9GAMM|nr:MASE1 domain-containing protein [Dyella acidiphila]MBE1162507.1 MASE1 domain-containing protein [Dyella acidiphila]